MRHKGRAFGFGPFSCSMAESHDSFRQQKRWFSGYATTERRTKLFNEYDVYHDESKLAGYWHGILFVPRDARERLLKLLQLIRQNTERKEPISLKYLGHAGGPLHRCLSGWLQVGVAALLQSFQGKPYFVPTGLAGRNTEFVPFSQTIRARFVLFRVSTPMKALTLCPDHVSRVETTFRMALKGGLTLFSNLGDELCVRSLHFDGHKHYGRRLDRHRILRNVENPPEGTHGIVLDDRTSDHREIKECQSYDDCQLLQLTDILVSGFRAALAEETASDIHRVVCKPLSVLADKWKRRRKGFSNSRWHKGFCMSEGSIDAEGRWQFSAVKPTEVPQHPHLFQ